MCKRARLDWPVPKSSMAICIPISRRVCKYAMATSLSCMRDVSVTSSVRCWAAFGGSACSQVEK